MANKIEIIVRHYVKKFLAEALSDFDVLVERKIQEKLDLLPLLQEEKPRTAYREIMTEEVEPPVASAPVPKRKITPEVLGITDETWKDIYNDTLASGNPILESAGYGEESPPDDKPELVPEHVLQGAGIPMDFSKHMEVMERKDQARQADLDLEAKRQEILKKTIK